jgi:hypothetical protein
MNLDKAFIELNNGLDFFDLTAVDKAEVAYARALLSKSLAAYKNGDKIQGAHLLQDFEEFVFPG